MATERRFAVNARIIIAGASELHVHMAMAEVVQELMNREEDKGLRDVKIRSFDDMGTFSFEEEPVPLDTPINVTATVEGPAQVRIDWSAVTGAESYEIERDGQVIATGVVELGFTDSGLTAATTYQYRVRAVNVDTASGWSSVVSATTDEEPTV